MARVGKSWWRVLARVHLLVAFVFFGRAPLGSPFFNAVAGQPTQEKYCHRSIEQIIVDLAIKPISISAPVMPITPIQRLGKAPRGS
jgi:hypothetical protein